ncbi:MAG TPA: tRNA guanosine(34) transglycosylase Tgt [Candidatus Acidoferrales bacterium]|nr:tRNA guanosine(34) transglycosylase Tgt [Candidatus Acidoferrales bacterium]
MSFRFDVLKSDPSGARLGRLETPHGVVETPAFLPVGTLGTVKGLTQESLEDLGAQILLANTYHLHLRPGEELIREMGGLHKFMSWPHPILTDSGGYQVFSLSAIRKVTDEGVTFRSHLDGSEHFLSPEKAVEIQVALGSDIMMVLDECIESSADEERARAAVDRTLDWARRSFIHFAHHGDPGRQMLFGIVQGGAHRALRRRCAEDLVALGFPGYAIGGLAVGEPHEVTCEITAEVASRLPADRPRYLMGVGRPEQIADYVARGVDMMDCVLPTRSARHGCLFTWQGRLLIKNVCFKNDQRPIDLDCECPACRRYSRAYIRHLVMSGEMLGAILSTLHNVYFYLDIMHKIRKAIRFGNLLGFCSDLQARLAGRVSESGVESGAKPGAKPSD